MFDSPRQDEFTQGTIFSCATAENYPTQSVSGLVITARCDAAQDKAPIYNFVPVVALTDWIVADGGQIALERAVTDCENSLRNILSQAGLSETLLKSKTPLEIHDAHLAKKAEQDRKWVQKCSSFLDLAKTRSELHSALNLDNRIEKQRLLLLSKKIVDMVVRELASNRLLGHYLLRGVPNIHDETVGDYVALLREIHHIPSPIAKRIAKGLSRDDIAGDAKILCPRFVGDDDYSMPVARLKSPWIEHLMQSLTMVFARIGVDDVDFLAVKKSLAPPRIGVLMKYIFMDGAAVEDLINERLYQSIEFQEGRDLVAFIRGELATLPVSTSAIAIKKDGSGYIISPHSSERDYVVFDLEEAASMFELDNSGLLLAVQKTLRFCKKLWGGLLPSKHERILSNGKAVVFPYPIGLQTALRVTIDRNPDEKRRSKRESGQAYLVYKFSDSEGEGPSETPRLTNFRKAVENRSGVQEAALSELANRKSSRNGASSLSVTELERDSTRPERVEVGLDAWRRWLTTSQLEFVTSTLTVPHRIEGPAGTGKTLCLTLKAIHALRTAAEQEKPHRTLFVAHSQATKLTIENLIAMNGGDDLLAQDDELLTRPQTLRVTTLHELCAKLLRREISETELVDKDAYESKITQKLYAIEAVERAMNKDFSSHKPYLSTELDRFLDTTDKWAIAEMLQHEISVQIKGRAGQDLQKYKELPSLKFGLPIRNAGDKAFVFVMHDEYQRELVASAQFDTDDVVLSAMSQLATPIWKRRRAREGFDSIFIDETHLFNLNELSIFHKLTKVETSQPIAYSVDRSQALGDRGWTDESFDTAFDPESEIHGGTSTAVKSVFRCSPDIIDLAFSVTSSGATLFTNFQNPLIAAVSAFSAEDERKCAKPCYLQFVDDDAMISESFSQAESLAREMAVQRADIAVIAFGDDLFERLTDWAQSQRKATEVIKSRGDLQAVERARQGGKFVLSAPEFVGGLEFSGVVLVGVDGGRVPPKSSGAGDSQAFLDFAAHQRLYVAITRAKFRVVILGVRARGVSETLASAQASELLDVSGYSK